MLTKEQKNLFRSDLFRHLDGIATAPTAYCLYSNGVLDHLLEHKVVDVSELSKQFNANEGYLNVALRILCSQGWLSQKIDNSLNKVVYEVNDRSKIAFDHIYLYKDNVDLLKYSESFSPRVFNIEPFRKLEKIFTEFQEGFGLIKSNDDLKEEIVHQIMKHLEGIITAPSIVALGMGGMFHKYFMEANFRADEFHKDPVSFGSLLDFFSFLGWFKKSNETYRFTDKGLFFAKRASAYGVTVSYQNTFRHLDDLIFGNPMILKVDKPGAKEKHVDREMNVWGSGGAHGAYFKKVDEIIISLFNKPIEEQPKGIVDMGCGNGAYLEHLFNVIDQQTLRGQMLEEYPLFLVGADYNQAALKVTRANLIAADIWAKVIWGDIGRPDLLARDLNENYGIELSDLLNVRTFLDHNRIWQDPKQIDPDRISESTGAFASRGIRVSNNHVEDNLLEHLKKWAPFVKKFGLLVIELHTVNPSLVSKNLGKTAATAYDATHGFSDQYIVEVEVFNKIASEAGLNPVAQHFSKFPNSDLASVSINLLRG